MDPNLHIPFATISPSLKPTFDFLEPLAVYYCGITTQVVGREKKQLVTFLAKDAMYFAKKDSGLLARRIAFAAIRSMHTNVPDFRKTKRDPIALSRVKEPFLVVILSPQERTDLILVGDTVVSFLPEFRRVWEATGFSGRCPFEESVIGTPTADWAKFTDLKVNYRVPQSSREGKPTTIGIPHRDTVLAEHARQLVSQDFPESTDGGGGSTTGIGASPGSFASPGSPQQEQSSPIRSVTFVNHASGAQSPAMVVLHDAENYNVQTGLAYASFAPDERTAFPSWSRPSAGTLYCERHFVFSPTSGTRNHVAGTLVDAFVVLTSSHLYCAVTEERVLRCCSLQKIQRLFWVRDVSELSLTNPTVLDLERGATHAVLVQFQDQPRATGGSSSAGAGTQAASRVDHDVLLLFSTEGAMRTFSGTLEQIMATVFPSNGAKFNASATLSLTNPILGAQEGYRLVVEPVADKLDARTSAQLARAKSMASPNRADSGASLANRSFSKRSLSAAYLGRSVADGGANPDGVPNPAYEGLMSIVKDDPQLLEEYPVSAELKERHPPLATGSVFWANRLVYHPSPLRKQAGQRSSELMVGFITRSQFVVANNGENHRIFPVKSITAIRVKTIPRKSGEHSRQVIVLVGEPKGEHDLCVEIEREDEGRVMLNQLLVVIKKLDAYNVPSIRAFHDVEAEKFRFEASKFYQAPELDLPLSFDTIAYRKEIRQRVTNLYMKHNPEKVDRVDGLMREYEGKELQLLDKMRQKFGNDVDIVSDDLFGYRKRLVAFCEKYLPESLEQVDRVLREYRGQEDRMFATLVKRFGPEPQDPVVTPAAREAALRKEKSRARLSTEDPKTRLLRIYAKHQPSKIGMIDEILLRYKGDEDVLFRKLEKLYGPEPEPTMDQSDAAGSRSGAGRAAGAAEAVESLPLADRVTAMAKRYTPNKVNSIPQVLQQFKGREAELLKGLVKKYGPEPIPCIPATRMRLAAFFANHLPEPMPDEKLDGILSAFRGTEKELYESLEKRYGSTGPYSPKTNAKPSRPAAVLADSSSEDEATQANDGSSRGVFSVFNADGSIAKEAADKVPAALRKKGLRSSDIRSDAKEDKLESVLLASIDMLTDLPYVEVPQPVQHLFPSFGRAAIFLFERVLHWEPGTSPELRYLYMTTSHIYLASTENKVHRCIRMADLRAVFLTTKRQDVEAQCSVLLKLHPVEHDCFFSVEGDFEAKRFAWMLVEIQHKYHPKLHCAVCPVASLLDDSVDAHCRREERFELHVEPVKKRRKQVLNEVPFSAATQELFSRLHEAVIEKRYDDDCDALLESRSAAMRAREPRGIVELSKKDRKIFGVGSSATRATTTGERGGVATAASPSGLLATEGTSVTERIEGSPSTVRALYRGAVATSPEAIRFLHGHEWPRPHEFEEVDDANEINAESARRKLNPLQRTQFFVHSHTGYFGTATSGRGMQYVDNPEDARYASGSATTPSFSEVTQAEANASAGGGDASDMADVRSDKPGENGSSSSLLPVSAEQALRDSGILGVSETFQPTPLDRLSRWSTGFSSPPLPQGISTTKVHGAARRESAPSFSTPQQSMAYARVAVAPPPPRLSGVSADDSTSAPPWMGATSPWTSTPVFFTPSLQPGGGGNHSAGESKHQRFHLESVL